ncbi:MAG: GatB/YqeY domain-containing protein [Gammaproteobacteria bacterium]
MTTLRARITEDMKAALKAGEALRLHTVRLALSELKRHEADKGGEVDDATALGILEKMVKQRRDSEQQFRAGNRPDLADKEAGEIRILLAYMPQQLSEAEVLALVEQGKAETGAAGGKDMGKLMAWLKPRVAGKTDMGKLSGLVKSRLG